MITSSRLAGCAVVLFSLVAAGAQAEQDTALSRIERAYAQGRIDAPTRALLGLELVRAPGSLPDEFRPAAGEAPVRCGTLLARRAWMENELGSFSEEQSAQFALGVTRPTLDSNFAVFDSAGTTVIARIHYAAATTSLVQAEAAAAFVTESWTVQVEQMGWRTPPEDGGAGGSNPDVELDIYLDPAQNGGVTVPDGVGPETWDDAASFIVLEPGVPSIQTFIAHELNHSLQYAYDVYDGDLIYEATAVWMEDQVFDSVDDYAFYVGDFQAQPHRTLSFATTDGYYMYGAAVFVHYLAGFGGDGHLIEPIWEGLKQSGGTNTVDFYDSIEAATASLGFADMEAVYADFAGIRFLTGTHNDGSMDEGLNGDSVAVLATMDLASLENGTSASPPMGLGANYLVVTTADAEPDDTVTLTVHGDDEGPWAITVVRRPATGVTLTSVVLDDDGDGTVEATASGLDQLVEVAFAVSHLAGVDAGPDLSTGPGGHTADLTTHGFSYTFVKEKEAAGCGCHIPVRTRPLGAASVAGAFALAVGVVLLRRRVCVR